MLKIDTQEPKNILTIAEALSLDFERKRLPVGDFVYENICIERKEIKDFISSLSDGRLLVQIQNMVDNYDHNYLIISGNHVLVPSNKLNNYLGMLTSIAVRTPVKILHVKNDTQLMYVVKKIIEKHSDGKSFNRKVVRQSKGETPALSMLCQIPGVGAKAAKLLLDEYTTIRDIACADVKELPYIKGIGVVTSRRIHGYLTNEW